MIVEPDARLGLPDVHRPVAAVRRPADHAHRRRRHAHRDRAAELLRRRGVRGHGIRARATAC